MNSHSPIEWTTREHDDAEFLVQRALNEDLQHQPDPTTTALIPPETIATVSIGARRAGIIAGLPIISIVADHLDSRFDLKVFKQDGDAVAPGDVVATLRGQLNDLLVAERTILNFLIHLSGIATLTSKFVAAVSGTQAQVLDTRKTIPGYRHLAKYAVRCGGGVNHRLGLYDGILIKDNHLAGWQQLHPKANLAQAIEQARQVYPQMAIEVEVDTLEQLREVLTAQPTIVLLDNMSCTHLIEAVSLRNLIASQTLLEASGGVDLTTITDIARTGVERISVGALTHSATALDLGFDWHIERR